MTEATAVFVVWLTLTAIIVFIWTLYRDLTQDNFRQGMFAIRDDLFDFAAKGGISFEHDAYRTLRTTMNGFIRFAHRMSVLHMILLAVTQWRRGTTGIESEDALEVAMRGLPHAKRAAMQKFRKRMNRQTLRYLVFSSPTLLLIVIILRLLVPLRRDGKDRLTLRLNREMRTVDAVAYRTGDANGMAFGS